MINKGTLIILVISKNCGEQHRTFNKLSIASVESMDNFIVQLKIVATYLYPKEEIKWVEKAHNMSRRDFNECINNSSIIEYNEYAMMKLIEQVKIINDGYNQIAKIFHETSKKQKGVNKT